MCSYSGTVEVNLLPVAHPYIKALLDDLHHQLAIVNHDLTELKSNCLSCTHSEVLSVPSASQLDLDPVSVSVCSISNSGVNNNPSEPRPVISGASRTSSLSHRFSADSDARKFNVVVYGIAECARGTHRTERSRLDLESITNVLTETDATFNPLSIRDHIRLGKFVPDSSRPRPLLVKLNRSSDVQSLLSKENILNAPFRVKPDLSPEDRAIRSSLMKEKFSLIEGGTDSQSIRVTKTSIFINRRLYGKVVNGQFQKFPTIADVAPVLSDTSIEPLDSSTTPPPVLLDSVTTTHTPDIVHPHTNYNTLVSNTTQPSLSTAASEELASSL